MAISTRTLARLLAGASMAVVAGAACGSAYAADATPAPESAGTEGSSADQVIITAEQGQAAANAPSKASLQEFQPESIISRQFIEQAVPETGSWVEAAAIAPGVSGVPSNSVGETSKLTMRGFQDGQYNITYDGIAFGDTNGPTHHQASYWPASTIGAVVWDRGPGAAGDLGQANFGGALHMFSADPSHQFGAVQKVTAGSFGTVGAVTTINTGEISQLMGGRLMLNFDERSSTGELSYSGGVAQNQLAKFVLPIGQNWSLTLFGSHNYTRFYQSDAGPGETWSQVVAYGRNFALTDTPGDEHYYKYNPQSKQTDFDYADIKGDIVNGLTFEDQLYTYFYTNKTYSVNSITDPVGGGAINASLFPGNTTPNATSLISTATASLGEGKNDVGGYYKLNQYRVYGDIVRLNKDWSFGTLKIGGVYEWSGTDRANELEDFTLGGATTAFPDYKYNVSKYLYLPATTNAKTLENSAYQTWQAFGDFDWRPIDGLTISPGIKFLQSKIEVNAADEKVAAVANPATGFTAADATAAGNQPLVASNTYSSPMYFLTVNYRIRPELAAYAQVATGFLLPGLPNLYFQAANIQSLQPEKTVSYQGGLVYSRGNLTADADIYRVDASNLQVSCTVDNESSTCNAGNARWTGEEGEVAYHLDFGVTLFANGALISAKNLATAANPGAGIVSAIPASTIASAPKWTDAIGAMYRNNGWTGSIIYTQSGAYVAGYTGSQAMNLPGWDSLNGSLGYDFGKFGLKLQAINLLDHRAITGYNGGSATASTGAGTAKLFSLSDLGLYTFQEGRMIQATLIAKF